jgi:CBS domain-containing protein
MRLKDIMTKEVACVSPNDPIERAAQLMQQYNVGSIPVVDNGKVTGILTDRDIALRSVAQGGGGTQTVSSVMTPQLVVGTPDMDAKDAARVMGERQIRRLPIVEGGTLVGIVALADISTEPALQNKAKNALHDISQPGDLT